MKGLRTSLLVLFALVVAACSRPAPRLDGAIERSQPWDKDVVAQMAAVPIQDNGRIKPLSVWAAFTLYHVHGRRDLKYSIPDASGAQKKVTLEPTEWLLDVWCYPRQAERYPLFRIENSGVLDALGFANDGQKQGFEYLSYVQVYEVVGKLQELAKSYQKIATQERSEVQKGVLALWPKFLTYDRLQRQLVAFHHAVSVTEPELQQAFGGDQVTVGDLVTHVDAFRGLFAKLDDSMTNASKGLLSIADFVGKVMTSDEDGVGLIAPIAEDSEQWMTLGEGFGVVIRGHKGPVAQVLTSLHGATAADTLAGKQQALLAYRDASLAAAAGRFDLDQIEHETYYYRASWHYQSIHWFLLAFFLAAVCWLMPRNKTLWWLSMGITALALGMLSYDLVLRCIITDRPPIKNLYDTFLFIAAVGVALAMAAEFVIPRRIALAAAPFLGALLVMFARLFEVTNHQDTMDPLSAVLDSNFWLATHVTTINIGYAAGLLAAVLANVWILMRVLRLAHPSAAPAKALVRMIYGVTCFGLVFAVVGTILGGVWANDSWGRFWGWDPKENGALMICLAQISMLHARMSGWVRDFGFVIWAAITGMVVVFSWFHVNQLEIGLHSYGFSDAMLGGIWTSYMVQGGFVVVGAIDVLLRPNPVRAAAVDGAPPPVPVS